ncbi:YitT family protein [Caloramator sp. mosi_1]|uniref:YitT family protein n=1 Tax=Caloramator sp. mosi_1 TaxID=3023090 RepID=UPI0023605B6B|nr:YitT family protein [Caloramator sp. mosi_1]WDC85312.1 YitT family protein [Caloramator sp. mosi_1]
MSFRITIKRIIFIAIGCLISAVGINAFIIPHKLLSGGVSGIAILLQYLLRFHLEYLYCFLIYQYFYTVKRSGQGICNIKYIWSSFFSFFLTMTKGIREYININDILLSCIYGGVLNGIGVGIALKNKGSMGGTDIIAVATKKKLGINISTLSFGINIVVVILGSLLSSVQTALYTLISMYVSSKMLDKTLKGLNNEKMLLIVTDKVDEVSNFIINDIHRGITYLYGEGAYTNKEKKVMYCIVTLNQLEKVKAKILEIDNRAFITVLDAAEVRGKGFKVPLM